MSKPRIFIGSSKEGLKVANAIHRNLDRFSEPTIWTHDVFQLSVPTITSLVRALDNFDFAIFIFTPDDIATIRGEEQNIIRDNVIFETGLFAGKYGTEKVFFLKPRDIQLHLPSDLLGVTSGDYAADREDGNLLAATNAFCDQVQQTILRIIAQPDDKNIVTEKYLKDLRIIQIYMKEKNWTSISFKKITENINPRFTEDYLMKIIETFPDKIRRCRLSEGKFGIKLLDKE